MTPKDRALLWRYILLACILATIGILAGWLALRTHNSWAAGMPHHVAIHRGRVLMLSPLWSPPPPEAKGWMYDLQGHTLEPAWPPFRKIGVLYSPGPSRWAAPLHAIIIPVWALALIPALAAVPAAFRWHRWKRRARGGCLRCGYPRSGLDPAAPCPECGRSPRTDTLPNSPDRPQQE